MKKQIKKHRIFFRADDILLSKIEELTKKMKVSQSATIRIAVQEAIIKYIDKDYEEELVVMDKERVDDFLNVLLDRI